LHHVNLVRTVKSPIWIVTAIERDENREFRQLLPGSSRCRLRQRTTYVFAERSRGGRNGDIDDVYSLGDCNFSQSRVSTGTSSQRDWLRRRQRKTADVGRQIKASSSDQFVLLQP